MQQEISINTKIYKWSGDKATWYFMSVSKKKIETMLGHTVNAKKRRGWGSIPVKITIGETSWKTSVFPSKTEGYVFPIKKNIRKAEGLEDGQTVIAYLMRQ